MLQDCVTLNNTDHMIFHNWTVTKQGKYYGIIQSDTSLMRDDPTDFLHHDQLRFWWKCGQYGHSKRVYQA